VNLFLLRHASAEEADDARWPDDQQRPLTKDGIRRFRKVARGLREVVDGVDIVYASRFVRAWTTAVLLTKEAGWPAATALPELEPAHSAADVLSVLARDQGRDAVCLVGHEPNMSELLRLLVGSGNPAGQPFAFKKGGAALISIEGEPRAGSGTLEWLATPKILRKLV
jgi:phosphohistidine phosphatase